MVIIKRSRNRQANDKPQLLQKVRQIKSKHISYVDDNMAKDAGHTVLRLPPNHCEFIPIELAWAMIKGYVKSNNTTFKTDDVRALLNASIERVTDENCKNCIRHVMTEEDKVWQVDTIMDDFIDNLEPCVLTINYESSSHDDSK